MVVCIAIALSALYPAVGGTLIISISYDALGNETSKIFSSYDEDGKLVEQVDMLAVEQQQATAAETRTSSKDLRVSSSSSWLDEFDDGGSSMMPVPSGAEGMMSMPEGPQEATEEFIYDHLGNRYLHTDKNGVISTFTHNRVNQYEQAVLDYPLIPDETVTFTHDDNGNLQTDKYGTQYSYDYRNRLTEISGTAQYGYDALGRRISKYDEDKSLTTYFYYDSFGRVIAEYEKPDGGDEAFARSFVYGNGFNEVLAMFTPYHAGDASDMSAFVAFCDAWLCTDPNDGCYDEAYDHNDDDVIDFEDFAWFASVWDLPSSRESNWYYLRDAVGSIRGVIGGRFGREEDREFYNYDAYGQLSLQNPEESKCGNPYLFAGYRYDPEAGLYYVVNRTYDSETGRFLQTDPIGYADSMNLYEYVVSNPTNWVDPWGLKGIQDTLTPQQLNELLTNPDAKDLEKVCDDEYLCYVADLLKFKEGRLTLFTYLFDGGMGALEHDAMGMVGVNVANAGLGNAFMLDDELYLGDPFITAGEVRQPFRNKCYLKNCEKRMHELARDAVVQAVSQAVTAGATQGAGLLLRTAQAARGAPIWQSMSPCMDDLFRTAANAADDLAKPPSLAYGVPPNEIATPYGVAVQQNSAAALQMRGQIQQGMTMYKGGYLQLSETELSQFLAKELPFTPGYAAKYGLPARTNPYPFILTGRLRPSAPVITRISPPIPPNPGGGIEAVINPGDFIIDSFVMP